MSVDVLVVTVVMCVVDWAGNEPDIFSAYLFAWAGRIDLTQKWVRKVLDVRFTSKPSGIPGNDDYGTMSSWVSM
jgi:putative alpha-1,2-mannosidase